MHILVLHHVDVKYDEHQLASQNVLLLETVVLPSSTLDQRDAGHLIPSTRAVEIMADK